jgi:hypothetical protein
LTETDFAVVIPQAERASSTKSNPVRLLGSDWEQVLKSSW